jgi:hypothetical protein
MFVTSCLWAIVGPCIDIGAIARCCADSCVFVTVYALWAGGVGGGVCGWWGCLCGVGSGLMAGADQGGELRAAERAHQVAQGAARASSASILLVH